MVDPSDDADQVAPTALRGRMRRVDELDRKIIKMLQADGRLSNTEVARSLDITETTVRKRIARLLDERLISIVAVPTPEATGMTLSAIMGVSVELTAIREVASIDPHLPRGPVRGHVVWSLRPDSRGILH